MNTSKVGENTICTHVGEIKDEQFKGAISPMYLSTAYEFMDVDIKRYPRYFNTPNQEFLAKKIAALENAETALIFGSGMAVISTTLLTFLSSGDHIVLQKDIYGGTRNLVEAQFDRYNIEYTFAEGLKTEDFKACIQDNTKIVYIETPSNPLLKIVDVKEISDLCRSKGILSVIDNTFATPIIQKPINLGIDIVLHSATKYFGGHSDICAGAVAASQEHIESIWNLAKDLGGSLSDFTVWMLERSMKTLGIRVKQQNKVARKMAKYLERNDFVKKVYYPGLKSHPDYRLAKKQMKGFGAMLSFDLKVAVNAKKFLKSLELIKPSMSLAGVESTMILPAEASHSLLTPEERLAQGISDSLIRFSVGIENTKDLIADIEQAIEKASV